MMSRIEMIPHSSPLSDDDEVTEAAAGHRVGRLLEIPLDVGERGVRGQVLGDVLDIRILVRAQRADQVALGDDPRAGLLGIHDHHGAHVVLRHEARRLAQGAPGRDREHVPRHRVSDLHDRPLLSDRSDCCSGRTILCPNVTMVTRTAARGR